MCQLLVLDPSKRIKTNEALLHPYFKDLLDKEIKLKEELLTESESGRVVSSEKI